MKSLTTLLVVATLLLCSGYALAGDIKIIANSNVNATQVSADELKRVFLLETNDLRNGAHVEPVLRKGGAAHQAFLKDVLDINDEALQLYYRTQVFTGRGSMPRALGSDAECVAYIAKTKGAIGYVSIEAVTAGVKTLEVTSSGYRGERALLTHVDPKYPEALVPLHLSGTVRLVVTISPKGSVEDVQVLGGNPLLAESAIAAVKQWVYAAGGSRVKTAVSLSFDSYRP
jgi:TonB family protein